MPFLLLKWIHILSAILLLGTGLGSAFYLWRAQKERDLGAMRFTLRNVILADWLFTVPPIILLPLTGVWMMQIRGYAFSELWLWLSVGLYVFAGLCWLPAAYLQYRMKALAESASGVEALPPLYAKYERLWLALGAAAFPAVILIFTLMILKPSG